VCHAYFHLSANPTGHSARMERDRCGFSEHRMKQRRACYSQEPLRITQ
jgi:hypothetical protein